MDSGLFISHTVRLVWDTLYVDAGFIIIPVPGHGMDLNAEYLIDPVLV